MSMQSKPEASRLDLTLILIGVMLVLGIFWYAMSNSQQVLRRSPLGLDGLQAWLSADGHPVQVFSGGWTQNLDEIGLRVLPIHDTAPGEVRTPPGTKQEYLLQSDEFDISATLIGEKAKIVPTLIVLPKWRSGLRLTGIGHPLLLIEDGKAGRLLTEALPVHTFKTRYIMRPFSKFDVAGEDGSKTAQLYVAQVFSSAACTPIVGDGAAMVLGECRFKSAAGGTVLVLSDPDLLNNHGLRLGDNAHIVRDILLEKAGDKSVLIDYSKGIWLFPKDTEVTRERTWSDLLQFFAYPFSLLWISGGILMLLVLWRAGVRYGPVTPAPRGLGAEKTVANTARARLMRLTGQDGALLSDYVDARLAGIGLRYLGPTKANGLDATMRYIARKRPDLVDGLNQTLAVIKSLPAHLSAGAAITYVDKFEQILEQLEHDT